MVVGFIRCSTHVCVVPEGVAILAADAARFTKHKARVNLKRAILVFARSNENTENVRAEKSKII